MRQSRNTKPCRERCAAGLPLLPQICVPSPVLLVQPSQSARGCIPLPALVCRGSTQHQGLRMEHVSQQATQCDLRLLWSCRADGRKRIGQTNLSRPALPSLSSAIVCPIPAPDWMKLRVEALRPSRLIGLALSLAGTFGDCDNCRHRRVVKGGLSLKLVGWRSVFSCCATAMIVSCVADLWAWHLRGCGRWAVGGCRGAPKVPISDAGRGAALQHQHSRRR